MSYSAVIFNVDDTVAAVPSSWIKNDKCKWPNYRDRAKLSRADFKPGDMWLSYEVRVLRSSSNYYLVWI